MNSIFVAYQVCAKDHRELLRLLKWCSRLGPYKSHDAVIVADCATPAGPLLEALTLCRQMFSAAYLVSNAVPVAGWVEGPKSLFIAGARWCAARQKPFLVMETDCVPLRAGWLDEIDREFTACGRPFMGHIYPCGQPGLPASLMSGIGVYAPDIIDALPMIESGKNWDVAMTPYVLPRAHHTKLIHHFWGQPDLPPTFARRGQPGTNIFDLERIPSETVLWHRNKDGSLIRLLERKLFPAEFKPEPIAVCFNVHAGDIALAVLHAEWLIRMGKMNQHLAVICHDPSCPVIPLNAFEGKLRRVFARVETFVYPRPPTPTYPASANWAWQSTAHRMAPVRAPWLWFEADAIALKPDWLDQLQAEYDREGASFMGPVVPSLGHINGGAVYPADAAHRMPRAMSAINDAWDMHAREDMGADRHDAMPLMFHMWSLVNRMAHPVGGGDLPLNVTAEEIQRWLPKESVYLHRIKDASVLNLLLSGQFKP